MAQQSEYSQGQLAGVDGPAPSGREYSSKGDQLIPYSVNGFDSILMVKQTMARLANDIYNHNMATKFTQVTIMAMPGSGKTTFDRHLVHELHKRYPPYRINVFENEDILQLDKILKALPKYVPCINVFTDVSYIMEKISKDRKIEILDRLSRVREVLDPENKATPSILITEYHYSFAMLKSFRQTPFKVHLSITDEERENYLKSMGYHNKEKIIAFMKIYLSTMRYGKWFIRNPSKKVNNGRPLWYRRDKPFRPALVSNFGELHLTYFHPVDCAICNFKKKRVKPDPDYFLNLLERYGYYRTRRSLINFAYSMTGDKMLYEGTDRAVRNSLHHHFQERPFDTNAVAQIFKSREVKDCQNKVDRVRIIVERLSMLEGKDPNPEDTARKTGDAIAKVDAMSEAGSNEAIEVEDEDLEEGIAQRMGKVLEDDSESEDGDYDV